MDTNKTNMPNKNLHNRFSCYPHTHIRLPFSAFQVPGGFDCWLMAVAAAVLAGTRNERAVSGVAGFTIQFSTSWSVLTYAASSAGGGGRGPRDTRPCFELGHRF